MKIILLKRNTTLINIITQPRLFLTYFEKYILILTTLQKTAKDFYSISNYINNSNKFELFNNKIKTKFLAK